MKQLLKLLSIEGRLTIRSFESILFGICMPAGIMVLIGFIAGDKPAYEGASYTLLQASFGALITVGICATAFMGFPITISDYRDKKILKHFFVTPIRPTMILLTQVILSVVVSVISSLSVAMVAKFMFGYKMEGFIFKFIAAYILVMVCMLSLGTAIASVCKTVKITNVVCSMVYFPMLFLSGATIPYEIFPKPMQQVANVLPLTQGIKLLKGFSLGTPVHSIMSSLIILLSVTFICSVVSVIAFRWE